MPKLRKKRLIKHTSIYSGALITFQHYLNTHKFVLPFEDVGNGQHKYRITEWYKKGILTRITIEEI